MLLGIRKPHKSGGTCRAEGLNQAACSIGGLDAGAGGNDLAAKKTGSR